MTNQAPLHFILEKETKNTYRFQQVRDAASTTPFGVSEGAEVGTLYVQKSAFGERPARIEVTIR